MQQCTTRNTIQKQEIIDHLCKVHNHPTAEQILIAVRKKIPNISQGTVYRNLKKLVETGEVMELAGDPKRYDANTCAHAHFICKNCGKVMDIKKSIHINDLKKHNLGSIDACHISFHGICKDCQTKK